MPISEQGRLRVGVHVCLRGREAVFHFQPCASVRRLEQAHVHSTWRSAVIACGHVALLRAAWERFNLQDTDLATFLDDMRSTVQHGHESTLRWIMATTPMADLLLRPLVDIRWDYFDPYAGLLADALERGWDWFLAFVRCSRRIHPKQQAYLRMLECCAAARLGNMDMFRKHWKRPPLFLYRKDDLQEAYPWIVRFAARGGSVAIFDWVDEHSDVLTDMRAADRAELVDDAAFCGRQEFLQHLENLRVQRGDNRFHTCFTSKTMEAAAASGSMSVVEWLMGNGMARCSPEALLFAAEHGHLDMLKMLHTRLEGTCPQGGVAVEAVCHMSPGNATEIVRYLLENDLCQVTSRACVLAADNANVRPDLLTLLAREAARETWQAALEHEFIQEDRVDLGHMEAAMQRVEKERHRGIVDDDVDEGEF